VDPTDLIDIISPQPLLMIGNARGSYGWLHPPETILELLVE
jgi:hypothetical protein